jgi:hypothetical protein
VCTLPPTQCLQGSRERIGALIKMTAVPLRTVQAEIDKIAKKGQKYDVSEVCWDGVLGSRVTLACVPETQ